MDGRNTTLEDLFGSSSEDENDEKEHAVKGVPGLFHIQNFLGTEEQNALRGAIECQYKFEEDANKERNQAMEWGKLPQWAQHLGDLVAVSSVDHWPWKMASREPSFDQMIVNVYYPGQGQSCLTVATLTNPSNRFTSSCLKPSNKFGFSGIKEHVDLAKFDDGIASVSLGAACEMTFTHAAHAAVRLPLKPGDLLLLYGAARYEWMHGIPGESVRDGVRVSITLRRLLPIEERLNTQSDVDYFGNPLQS